MNKNESVLILGLGGAGIKVVSHLIQTGSCGFELAAIDTDKNSLASVIGKTKCILAGSTWRDGCGCGGDAIRGEQAVARERQAISALIGGKSLVVTVGGLGGGVATGGVRTVASVAKALGVPSVFMLTTPFSFESFGKRKLADECLDELLAVTDIVLRIPNDLLFSMLHPETPMEEAYAASCAELGKTALGIASMLSGESAFQTDYAGFMALLRGRKCSCGIGVGTAAESDGPERCSVAIERMLESPFLGGAEKLAEANSAILCLCGGSDLTLGETKRCLENLAGLFPKEANLLTGTNFGNEFAGSVQVTVVAIKYEDLAPTMTVEESQSGAERSTHVGKPGKTSVRGKRNPERNRPQAGMEQGVFELQSFSKGIFTDVAPTLSNGEDLDIPTFQRKGISIDKGIQVRS